jgi:hypothetical protein
MARTAITITVAEGPYGDYTAGDADLTVATADVDDKNKVTFSGSKILLIAHNTDAGAHDITVSSVADEFGRTGDITDYSLGADEYAVFGPFVANGWKQSDGALYFEADDATVKFGIVEL